MSVIRDEYARGTGIFGETCTHYLTITKDKLDQPNFEGAKYVCSPALRTQDDLEALWNAVRKGWLNAISSDHASFNFGIHKQSGRDSFVKIPNGAPGLENRIPIIWTEGVAKGRISRSKFVELCCTNPAKINGLYPQKGTFAIGSDADIVIFDPDYRGTVTNETSLHRSDYNAYEGWEQIGRADKVFLRGELVGDSGTYVGRQGSGSFISGKPFGLCYDLR
jgi:dihydropyrimidinase